jgi:prepilin-type N-terminal cleavage/methylation domain-containing protein
MILMHLARQPLGSRGSKPPGENVVVKTRLEIITPRLGNSLPPLASPYPLVPSPYSLSPSPYPLRPAWGFTLLELLIVMALLGVLTAVAYPSIGRGMGTLRLRTASREIAAAIRLARSKALREQQAYYLQFDIDKGEVELSSEDLKYQRSFSLPEGVVFRRVALLGEDNGPYSSDRAYYFAPNGLGENIEVMIANSHGRQMKIIQSSMVSSPKIEEYSNKP